MLHLNGGLALVAHHVQQSRRQGIEQPLPDKHTAEIVLGRRTLEFKDASDTGESVYDKLALLRVVFVKEVDQDFEPTTSVNSEINNRQNIIWQIYLRNEHLKGQCRCVAEQPDEIRRLCPAL